MFGSANVARYGFLEQILWQCCEVRLVSKTLEPASSLPPRLTRVGHKVFVFDILLALLQAFHQPPILVFEFGSVLFFDPG